MQNRREFLKTLAVGAAGIAIFPRITHGRAKDAWDTLYSEILGRIKPPTFPKKDFDIIKFGAKSGIASDSSAAIAKAIEACSKAGGGRVVIPAGEFLTGAVHLKSNINLYLAKDATLKF